MVATKNISTTYTLTHTHTHTSPAPYQHAAQARGSNGVVKAGTGRAADRTFASFPTAQNGRLKPGVDGRLGPAGVEPTS